MKAFILFALLGSISISVQSQQPKDKLSLYLNKNFNIRPVSTDMLDILSREVDLKNNKQAIGKYLNDLNLDIKHSKNAADNLSNVFNQAYTATRDQLKEVDYLSLIPDEAEKFGIDFLRYQEQKSIPQSIANYLPAVVQRNSSILCQLYANDIIQHEQVLYDSVKTLVLGRFKLMKDRGIAGLDTVNNYIDFAKTFSGRINDLPGLFDNTSTATVDYVNKEIIAIAYNLKGQYSTAKTAVITNVNDYNNHLHQVGDDVKHKVTITINSVNESFSTLIKVQEHVDDIINKVPDNLMSFTDRYKSELNDYEKKWKENLSLGLRTEAAKYKNQYDNAAQKLKYVTDFISDLNSGKITPENAIKQLESGISQKILGTDYHKLEHLFNDGFNWKDAETITNVAYNFTNFLGSTHLLNSEAAKTVSKFISYAATAIKIGTGVARLFAGDVTGIFSIVDGLGGLFGGSSGPSAEELMMKQIQDGFKQVNERLDSIDAHLVYISNQIVDLQKQMTQSFQAVMNELNYVEYKLDNLQELARLQLYNEYNSCGNLMDTSNHTLDQDKVTYTDLAKNYTVETGICLEGLNKFSFTKDNGFFYLETSSGLVDRAKVERQTLGVYKPTFNLFSNLYLTNDDLSSNASNSLLLPVSKTRNINEPLSIAIRNSYNTPYYNLYHDLNSLYNGAMITEFVNIFMRLSPYFEITYADRYFTPVSIEEYLGLHTDKINGLTSDQIALKTRYQKIRVQKLLDLTNRAIVQQDLLAGDLILNDVTGIIENAAFYKRNPSDTKMEGISIDLANAILTNNKILATNVATHLLNAEFEMSGNDSIDAENATMKLYSSLLENIDSARHYKELMTDDIGNVDSYQPHLNTFSTSASDLVNQINNFIQNNNQYITNFDLELDNSELTLKLKFTPREYKDEANKQKYIYLNAPKSELVWKDQMVYPDVLYELLDAKSKLKNKLFALSFNEKLPKKVYVNGVDQKVVDWEAYKLLYNYDFKEKK